MTRRSGNRFSEKVAPEMKRERRIAIQERNKR
jgi:hypothetical protein